jgi:outer membrane protein assembly factor BamB
LRLQRPEHWADFAGHPFAMKTYLCVITFAAAALLPVVKGASSAALQDWPGWRGPTRDGHAAPGQTVPEKWSETEKVVWRAPIRGRGHSSPTVAGSRVYLTSADQEKEEQLVICLDRRTGEPVWETVVHRGKFDKRGHRNTSHASATPAWDGQRLYVNFLNDEAVHTTALDANGKILWQRRVDGFVTHQGFGSSPVAHESVVLVTADHRGGGTAAALDKATGNILWQNERPKIANYSSPALVNAAGRMQMVIAGCNLVSSYDPITGRKLWEIEGSTEETVVTAVTDGSRVFASGGYPKNHIVAVEADGSGRIAWQNGARLYVPSPLVKDGHLYAMLDSGQAVCWRSDSGDELWREKVDKDFYSSPVMLGSRIYATSLRGMTSVFEASPKGFRLIAQNQLGDEAYASPAICGNRIYLRSAKKAPERQEFLWCVGE